MNDLDLYQRERIGTLRPLMQMISSADRREDAKRHAAERVGLSFARVESLYLDWKKRGDEALVDKRRLPRERKAGADLLHITDEERAMLGRLVAQCGSVAYALEAFADRPETRPELRDLINRHRPRRTYPKILRRAARITPESGDLARGPKRFNLNVTTQFRTNTWVDAAGAEHPLAGGDLFECDDMSLNQPFWFDWPYGGDELSDAFGVRLGRQMLACCDTATGKWIGFDLIGRVRDAYRAEDVMRFLGRIGDTAGLPRLGFRLERGVWAARSVRGIKGASDGDEQQKLGSLRDIVGIHYCYRPKGKGVIEGNFDMLQTILALSGIQIGRERGEFERTTALARKCAQGRMHPKDAGFPHITAIADRVADAMAKADARPKMGRLLRGVPAETFAGGVAATPLAGIPADRRHLFLPVKEVRPITESFVRYKVPHYGHTFSFRVPPEVAHLGRGYRLLVCFDPADPHAGARVFDAETDGRLHFDAVQGQDYGTFAYEPDAPQLDLSGAPRKRNGYAAAARTHFRALGLVQGTGASIDQAADGHGSSARIERGRAPLVQDAGNRAADALQARREHASRHDRAASRALRHVTSDVFLDDEDADDFSGETPRISAVALLD